MIDPGTIKEVWSLRMNDKALYDNLRIVGIWFTLKLEGLGLGAFNKMIY